MRALGSLGVPSQSEDLQQQPATCSAERQASMQSSVHKNLVQKLRRQGNTTGPGHTGRVLLSLHLIADEVGAEGRVSVMLKERHEFAGELSPCSGGAARRVRDTKVAVTQSPRMRVAGRGD